MFNRKTFVIVSLTVGMLLSPVLEPSNSLAAELAEIERRGKLIVGVKDNLPPLGILR